MKLILASNNKNKLREIMQILAPLGIIVLSQAEAGATIEVEETGTTFAENAALKARAIAALSVSNGCAVLADDSGLAVDALHGAPGVYSHRYAGEDATDAARCDKLLLEMRDVPDTERGAKFVCAMCLILPDGTEQYCEGAVSGMIGYAPAGENGFGYDPIFYRGSRSFAELTAEEKNSISHRAEALRQVYNIIKEKQNADK